MKIKTRKFNIFILVIFVFANFLFPLSLMAEFDFSLSEAGLIEELDPEVQSLKEEINNHQVQIEELQKQQKVYEESLRVKRQLINNLQGQVGFLDDNIAKLALEIQTSELQIEQTGLEVQNLQLQIKHKSEEIDNQQLKMAGCSKI